MCRVRYILRSVKHEVRRYIQLNLIKLNITHVVHVSFRQWYKQEIKGTFFIDSLKIESEAEFLISSGTFYQS